MNWWKAAKDVGKVAGIAVVAVALAESIGLMTKVRSWTGQLAAATGVGV